MNHYKLMLTKSIEITKVISFKVPDNMDSLDVEEFVRLNINIEDELVEVEPVIETKHNQAWFVNESAPLDAYDLCPGGNCDGMCDDKTCEAD